MNNSENLQLNVIAPKSLKLNVIAPKSLKLNIIAPNSLEDNKHHYCYILKSTVANKIYIGYTINFPRRLRQHNGELTGGAKRTKKWRPWKPFCLIKGFPDNHTALRFETRLQHPHIGRKKKGQDATQFVTRALQSVITLADGSLRKGTKQSWPPLEIQWYDKDYFINHPTVTNIYI